jgi:hypothetical protein
LSTLRLLEFTPNNQGMIQAQNQKQSPVQAQNQPKAEKQIDFI